MPGPPLRDVAEALLGQIDRMTAAMVEGYRARIPDYPAFLERHQEDVYEVSRSAVATFLTLLVEEREITPQEMAVIRRSGAARSSQGLPLESMLEAYSVGREIAWEYIAEAAEKAGVDEEAISAATLLLTRFMEKLSLAVTQGFLDHLREAYQGEHKRMAALVEVAKAMSRSLDLEEVVAVGLKHMRDALDLDWAGIWLVSVEKGTLRFTAQDFEPGQPWGAIGAAYSEVSLDQPFLGAKTDERSPVPYEASSMPEPVRAVGGRCLVIVPLLHRKRPIGAIAVVSGSRDELVPRDREFLVALAEQMSVAVHQVQEHMREARTDFLTGLANRHEFDGFLRRELKRAERFGDALSLAMIDLDDLKVINDEHGHKAGDEALRMVGATLKTTVRSLDLAARIGGDEFALVMPQTDARGARDVVARFQQHLESEAADSGMKVSVSVGIAEWEEGMDLDSLAAAADRELYGAKRSHDQPAQTG